MRNDIDNYIQTCEAAVRPVLNEIRRTVKAAIPDAREVLSYKLPALKKQRVFFYYAAFKTHIGIYPPVTNDKALIKELAPYANEKGNLRFPLVKPIPYELIARVALALDKQYSK